MIVVGIITPMLDAFNVQPAMIGQLVTIYAVSFAILSPILTKLTARFHDKKTLIISLSLFIIINFLIIFCPSFFDSMFIAYFVSSIRILSDSQINGNRGKTCNA